MLRNQAGFIAGKAAALSSAQATAGAALAAGRAGANQAYAMFGSAAKGIEGYNERLSNYGRDRTLADNTAVSKRQANEANTDSQVARKEEWSRGLNEVPVLGGPADLVRKWDSGVASTLWAASMVRSPSLYISADTMERELNTLIAPIRTRRGTPVTCTRRTARQVIACRPSLLNKAKKPPAPLMPPLVPQSPDKDQP